MTIAIVSKRPRPPRVLTVRPAVGIHRWSVDSSTSADNADLAVPLEEKTGRRVVPVKVAQWVPYDGVLRLVPVARKVPKRQLVPLLQGDKVWPK